MKIFSYRFIDDGILFSFYDVLITVVSRIMFVLYINSEHRKGNLLYHYYKRGMTIKFKNLNNMPLLILQLIQLFNIKITILDMILVSNVYIIIVQNIVLNLE